MFDRLRAQFSKLYETVTKSELKGKDLDKVLDQFQLELVQSDVAVSVAEYVTVELKNKLDDLRFARFSDPRCEKNWGQNYQASIWSRPCCGSV